MAMEFNSAGIWRGFAQAQTSIFGHLHEIQLTQDGLQRYAIQCAWVFAAIAGPVFLATAGGGALAGAMQNRFQATPEALEVRWDRLNPLEGFKRVFSVNGLVPSALSMVKLLIIGGLTYSEVQRVLGDPIFYTAVDVTRVGSFLIQSTSSILLRCIGVLAVIASLDYGWQFWKTKRDLMMTRQEIKEELKGSEGNPEVKSRQRQRRRARTMRQMLADVPKADVVVTNPTHLAVALRYDRKTMRAPRIVAKGSRLNALRIREIARSNQVPVIENKPLARMMFKHGRVGGEIPAQLYAAVAEILAWVYRINRYRYYAEGNQV
jgi:flagellar biosynthetic protein FlhB